MAVAMRQTTSQLRSQGESGDAQLAGLFEAAPIASTTSPAICSEPAVTGPFTTPKTSPAVAPGPSRVSG